MKCRECKSEMEKRTENVKYDECGLEGITLLDVNVFVCPNCGERMVGIKSIQELHRRIAVELANREERLGPAEIRFMRKYLGLSSGDFADEMSVDRSTVSRWESLEKPQAMGPQPEKLLRVLVLTGAPVETYHLKQLATKEPRPMRLRLETDGSGKWREAG